MILVSFCRIFNGLSNEINSSPFSSLVGEAPLLVGQSASLSSFGTHSISLISPVDSISLMIQMSIFNRLSNGLAEASNWNSISFFLFAYLT